MRRQRRANEEQEKLQTQKTFAKGRLVRENEMKKLRHAELKKGTKDTRDILDTNILNLKRRMAANALDRLYGHDNAKFHVPPNIPHL